MLTLAVTRSHRLSAGGVFTVADDDIVVEIGRYALENPPHRCLIASELEALHTPKARKLAQRINDQIMQR